MSKRNRSIVLPRLEVLEARTVLSTYSPAQLSHAYGLDSVSFSSGGNAIKGDGAGQTIALIDVYHDANIATELQTFSSRYGLPTASISVINQAGSTSNNIWAEEEALDVEWAHAAAPGANILVVEAASTGIPDLLTAINAAKNTAGVSVISMSFGSVEFSSESTYDNEFTTPSGHTSITFLASTGDNGAGTQWPASSPNVVAVGGTSLSLDDAGNRVGESSWSGSGGGYSTYESEPSYQKSAQSTGKRGAPDVALDADPNTGVSVYSVANGGWITAGGTSLSSPVWAGLMAIANQGRALEGKGTLDGATQTLPDLYAAPAGSFNDITTGDRATTGYDTVTGLGTPNAAMLVAALTGDPNVGAASPGQTYQETSTPTTTSTPPPSTPTSTPAPSTPAPTTPAPKTSTPTPTAPVASTPPAQTTVPPRTTIVYGPTVPVSITTYAPKGSHHAKVKKVHANHHAHASKVTAHVVQASPSVATVSAQAVTSTTSTTPTRVSYGTHAHKTHGLIAAHSPLAWLKGRHNGKHS